MPTAAELNVIIAAKLEELVKGVDKANDKLDDIGKGAEKANTKFKGLGKRLLDVGKSLGLVFGAQEVLRGLTNLVIGSAKLAAEAEGVEFAFKRLNNPGLLSQLKIATKGTLNDLELMKSAVQFDNFNLPLNQLATLMQFVQARAEQTGESVEFLRESLVEGLAKGSKLRLDNLGFSIQAINDKIEETGSLTAAVAALAVEEIDKMGSAASNAARRTDQLNSAWDNFRINFGKFINNGTSVFSAGITNLLNGLNNFITNTPADLKEIGDEIDDITAKLFDRRQQQARFNSGQEGFFEGLLTNKGVVDANVKALESRLKRLIELRDSLTGAGKTEGNFDTTGPELGAIQKLQQELEELQTLQPQVTAAALPAINIRIKQINEEIERLKALGIAAYEAKKSYEELKALGPVTPLDTLGLPDLVDPLLDKNGNAPKLPTQIKNAIPVTKELNNEMLKLGLTSQQFSSIMAQGLTTVIGLLGKGADETDRLAQAAQSLIGTVFSLILSGAPGGAALGGIFSGALFSGAGNRSAAPAPLLGGSANRALFAPGSATSKQLIIKVEGNVTGSNINLVSERQALDDFRNL